MSSESSKYKILVVDDEKRMVRFIQLNLEQDGFQVLTAYNGAEALEQVRTQLPDLILLDIMMPDISGFEVLKRIREVNSVPVIMLTAKGEEDDRIQGLELGADDYITNRLTIDFSRREVWVEGKIVDLRPTEYRLLYHLVKNAGWVNTHEQLLSKVWGFEYQDEPHYVRLYVNYLRKKLEKDPSNPQYILTERGVGYRFVNYRRDQEKAE
jgi:two-component system KDP operon response regulator KdpE